jgi:hypothetical protein
MFVRSPTVGEQVCVRYENEPEALFRVVPASTPSTLSPPPANHLATIFAGVKAAYPQTSWSFLDMQVMPPGPPPPPHLPSPLRRQTEPKTKKRKWLVVIRPRRAVAD